MIQVDIRTLPHGRPRQSRVGERRLRLRREADVLGCVGGYFGAVNPEAEEGVGLGVRVVDEDLGDVDVA